MSVMGVGRRFKSSRADQKSSKNQPVTAGFLCLFSERGSSGELLGKKSVKCCLLIALEHND